MYRNLFRTTLLIAAIAMILAACGAPIPTSTPAAATVPFTHTACAAGVDLTGQTVPFYHILDPNDQVETVYDPIRAGYTDAAEYFNAHGGICGGTLQQVFDDKNWGDTASIYGLFSALDPKPTVVTIYGSGAGEQLAGQLAKDQIPALNIRGGSSASAYGEDGQTLGWVFATNLLYADQVGAVCDYIVANPARFPNPVMGFMNSEDAWARTATEESRGYCESLGIGYAGASYFSGDDTYIVPHVQNLIDAGANIIYTNSHEHGPALVARTLTEMGLQDRVTLATVNRAMDPYVAFSGEADLGADGLPMISGMIGSLPVRSWAETDNPGIQLITEQADLHQRPLTMRTDGYIMGWNTTDLLIEVYIQTGNRVGFDHITGADVKETLENIVYAPLNGVERIDYRGGTRRALAENRIGEMNFLGQDGKTSAGAGNPPMLVKVGDQKHLIPMVIPLTDYQPAPDLRPGGADAPVVVNPLAETKVADSPLVGEWQRVNSCASFVQAFKEAGFIDLAPEMLVGGGYFTSLDQIDSTDLCKGATEVVHSHFFTADGRFGSHDDRGRQVDDGRYQMLDNRTITFLPGGDVTVHFNIEGDTLMFEVVVPEPCVGSCREATAWALSAFYPGPFLAPVTEATLTSLPESTVQVVLGAVENPVVFQSNRDGNNEIYLMNGDGSGSVNLTNNQADDLLPVWSPDGKRIIFMSNRDGNPEIYVMNADGRNQTDLTDNPADDELPDWSPDGTQIIFNANRDGNNEIYVMNADGSAQTNLTNNAANDIFPKWSADGTQIGFTSNRDSSDEIYVMNADGSNQTRLTHNPGDDAFPRWSFDGKKIVFEHGQGNGTYEIYLMNSDGSNQTPLTNSPGPRDDNTGARWSPDGTQIIFWSSRDGNQELYVMNADGSNQTRLTDNPAADSSPMLQP